MSLYRSYLDCVCVCVFGKIALSACVTIPAYGVCVCFKVSKYGISPPSAVRRVYFAIITLGSLVHTWIIEPVKRFFDDLMT